MMQYSVGELVVYGFHGICTVAALEMRRVDRKNVEYYVLEPIDGNTSKFYVPSGNEAAVAKIRSVLTEEKARALLSSDEVRNSAWIEDENLRKQRYKELIASGDRASMIGMVHCLHIHKKQLADCGRKFHLCDENFLRDAEKLLGSEIAFALKIPQDEVENVIIKALQA